MKSTPYDLRNVLVLFDCSPLCGHGASKQNWNTSCSGPPTTVLEADPWTTHSSWTCVARCHYWSHPSLFWKKIIAFTIDIVMDLKSFPDQPCLVRFWCYSLD
ncbi:hypothetical protein V6Z77_005378 [Aspergillus fumigatus]